VLAAVDGGALVGVTRGRGVGVGVAVERGRGVGVGVAVGVLLGARTSRPGSHRPGSQPVAIETDAAANTSSPTTIDPSR